jgi:Protein of unknown function (DUF4012)
MRLGSADDGPSLPAMRPGGAGPRRTGWARLLVSRHPLRRLIAVVLLVGVLAIPVMGAVSAYGDYRQLHDLGLEAVHHLLNAKDALLPSSSSSGSTCTTTPQPTMSAKTPATGPAPTATTSSSTGGLSTKSIPDAAHVATAEREFQMAQGDFRQLGRLLDQPNVALQLASGVPSVGSEVTSVRQLVYVGQDAATVGLNLTEAAGPILARLHGGALSANSQPLITTQESSQMRTAVISSISMLDDIQQRASAVDPSQLPISACQKVEYTHLLSLLPEVRNLLNYVPQMYDAAMWLIGVGQPRQFLVQTMDTAELRPTGGFTGDYGILQINGGRVGSFTLRDIDGVYLNTPYNLRPPAVYDWWPFPRWGLRDSNLSPDFPTTAQMNIGLFQGVQHVWKTIGMSNPTLDGVIMITTAPIAHILEVTGPIVVPKYNDTITAQNLEDKINYYQQDPSAIAKQEQLSPDVPTTPRKRFTYIVSQMLEQRVRQMSLSQLLSLAQIMLQDMKAHEIQVYVTNPQIEDLLLDHGYGSALDTTPGQDTLMIDQANVSVSKASAFVGVSVTDNVTLDGKGGATHNVAITIDNQPTGPYYGYTTYRDYVRVYVPSNAQLTYANGFDTGKPVCWVAPPWNPKEQVPQRFKSLPPCPKTHFFPDGSLKCPAGDWGPGPRSSDAFGADGKTDYPVDDTGYPTSTTSDVNGRAMFGGYVTVPEHCTGVVTLKYYVPGVALPAPAAAKQAAAYTYVLEREAGTNIPFNVTVHPAQSVAGESTGTVTYKGTLDANQVVTVPHT